jgi:hypothetical protein
MRQMRRIFFMGKVQIFCFLSMSLGHFFKNDSILSHKKFSIIFSLKEKIGIKL